MLMKATVSSGSQILQIDVIKHEGDFWLVPQWWRYPSEGSMQPARIIRLNELAHQKTQIDGSDFLVSKPLPDGLLDGNLPADEFESLVVHDNPNIRLPAGSA